MRKLGRSLTYSNVVATVALFMAVSGGVVYASSTLGRNAVKSQNIAAHAVKARNLAKNAVKVKSLAANSVTTAKIRKNAVTSSKVKKGTLTRADLAAGTLAGLPVAEALSASVPGVGVGPIGGTPVPLTGTASFTPAAGKSYELLVELKGNPIDADGPGEGACSVLVTILDNGIPISSAGISANANGGAIKPFGTSATAIALQATGQLQTLSALAVGDTGCGPGTTASLRAVVVGFG